MVVADWRRVVANRKQNRWRSGDSGHGADAAAAAEVTTAREQASRVRGEPGSRKVKEKGKRPQITLKNGAVVDARRAVTIVQWLQVTLARHPDQFKSLLALAEGRRPDADPRHFEELRANAFVENDDSIDPVVRDVLLNCYQV